MDRLVGMSVFVTAVDTGSFAAAGAALGLSAQMVGRHVGAIEDRLGARVLNRTTRRQSLTEVGRLYYERCRTVLAEAEAADAVADLLADSPRGHLRLAAPADFGACCVQPLVSRYLDRFADVQVELILTDRFVDIIGEGFDLGIRLGASADPSLTARPLAPHRLVPCAAPAYLATHGSPATPGELSAHHCLGLADSGRPPLTVWRFTRGGQAYSVNVEHRLLINDFGALMAAAHDGLGVILGAEAMVADALRTGALVRLLPDYDGPSRPLHVAFPAARPPPPKASAFIDMLMTDHGG